MKVDGRDLIRFHPRERTEPPRYLPDTARAGQGVGAIRAVKLGDALIKERLESLDEGKRSFSYSIVEGPLPAQNYLATVTVRESSPTSCNVAWNSRFDLPEGIPEEAIAQALDGAYGGALDALKAKLGA